ncbi:CBS domain-containing protein [Nesterenkonia halotolerans]|uniref:CBS domain-containing protein n=1 Tax=Nesterenkonia halotolerans TaxID=225325 RepID=UPI001CEF3F38
MSPPPQCVWMTQSLTEAVSILDARAPVAVVVDSRARPIGLLTKAAISREAARNPARWGRLRCLDLVDPWTLTLRPEDPLEEVWFHDRRRGPRPLPVFDDHHIVGLLYPESVLVSTPTSDRPSVQACEAVAHRAGSEGISPGLNPPGRLAS